MKQVAAGVGLGLCLWSAGACAGEELAWLAGQWCGQAGEERIEESWLPFADGRSYGVSRTLRGGRVGGFEFLRIEPVGGVATYLAQPGGRAATAFRRTAGGEGWVRFENPAHDFPQRIEYRREGERLRAEIAGPGRDGKEMRIAFQYARCKGEPAPGKG